MAAPAYANKIDTAGANATTLVVNRTTDGSAATGDLCVVQLGYEGSVPIAATLAEGWFPFGTSWYNNSGAATNGAGQGAVWAWHRLRADSPTSWTFTVHTSSTFRLGQYYRFTGGVTAGAAIDVLPALNQGNNRTTIDLGALTTETDDTLLVALGIDWDSASGGWTGASGYTTRSSGTGWWTGDKTQASAGSVSATTASNSTGGTGTDHAAHVALRSSAETERPHVHPYRVTATNGTAASSITLNKPTLDDDTWLVAVLVHASGSATPTSEPSGWSLIGSRQVSGTALNVHVYKKYIATAAGESATTYTWSGFASSARHAECIMAFSGADTTSIDEDFDASVNASSTDHLVPASTAVSADTTRLIVVATGAVSPVSEVPPRPSGAGKLVQQTSSGTGNDATLTVFVQKVTATGSTGTWTSYANTAGVSIGLSILLKPAVSGTTYSVNLAGTLTSAGALVKQPTLRRAGTLTSSGALIKQPGKPRAGTLTTAGALVKMPALNRAGTLTTAGAIVASRLRSVTLAGTLTTAGALVKTPIIVRGGTLASAGSLSKQIAKGLAGTLTSSGALVKQPVLRRTGTLTTAGAVTLSRVRIVALAGTLTTAGALIKTPSKLVAGTLTSSGALVKTPSKLLAGTFTTAGALVKQPVRLLSGTLTSAGAVVKQPIKRLAGTLTTAGTATAERITGLVQVSIAGTLITAGALIKSVSRVYGGTLTTAGSLVKTPIKPVGGTLTTSGALVKTPIVRRAGTLTSAGALSVLRVRIVALAGTITTAGALVKQPVKVVSGMLAPSGVLTKRVDLSLSGALTPAGALTKVVPRMLAGTLASAGAVVKQAIKMIAGSLGLAGSVSTTVSTAPPITAATATAVLTVETAASVAFAVETGASVALAVESGAAVVFAVETGAAVTLTQETGAAATLATVE